MTQRIGTPMQAIKYALQLERRDESISFLGWWEDEFPMGFGQWGSFADFCAANPDPLAAAFAPFVGIVRRRPEYLGEEIIFLVAAAKEAGYG